MLTILVSLVGIDRRSISDIPPTPPKRTSMRKDSESHVGEHASSAARMLRDSGFSESTALPSSYDDFVFVPPVPSAVGAFHPSTPPPPPIPLLSPRCVEPLSDIPPPLPPKVLTVAVDDEDEKSNRE